MTQSFVISLKPTSWNDIVGKNRWVYMTIKNEWKMATYFAIKQAKLIPIKEFPITVHIEAHWKEKRVRDIDNIFIKSVLDTLKKTKIIPDDSLKYIECVILSGKTGCKKDEMIVTWIE